MKILATGLLVLSSVALAHDSGTPITDKYFPKKDPQESKTTRTEVRIIPQYSAPSLNSPTVRYIDRYGNIQRRQLNDPHYIIEETKQ
jgi:hypothetical protein